MNKSHSYIIDWGTSLFDLLNFKNYIGVIKQNIFKDSIELVQNLENASTLNYFYLFFRFWFLTELNEQLTHQEVLS